MHRWVFASMERETRRGMQQIGVLLEEIDHFTIESYPAELDDLDFQTLCARYEDAKARVLAAFPDCELSALQTLRNFLETRQAVRAALELIWPERNGASAVVSPYCCKESEEHARK
ncbi:MAG: hypothetical protein P4L33_06225 [Capsulimonadaceae bacterium]|nr:hypothetical protein [Capsulimonadaceae bacterium]